MFRSGRGTESASGAPLFEGTTTDLGGKDTEARLNYFLSRIPGKMPGEGYCAGGATGIGESECSERKKERGAKIGR